MKALCIGGLADGTQQIVRSRSREMIVEEIPRPSLRSLCGEEPVGEQTLRRDFYRLETIDLADGDKILVAVHHKMNISAAMRRLVSYYRPTAEKQS